MRYISTRGGLAPAPFSDILLGGLAPDGGLTIPDTPERLKEISPNLQLSRNGLS